MGGLKGIYPHPQARGYSELFITHITGALLFPTYTGRLNNAERERGRARARERDGQTKRRLCGPRRQEDSRVRQTDRVEVPRLRTNFQDKLPIPKTWRGGGGVGEPAHYLALIVCVAPTPPFHFGRHLEDADRLRSAPSAPVFSVTLPLQLGPLGNSSG